MAVYKRVPLSSIFIGERARPIEEGYAQALAASMAARGLMNPITVRATPAKNRGKTPLTLVAGGHRHRGAEVLGWTEIDVIEVEADAVEAQLMELSENIYHNDLSALDRAVFVMKFREAWEDIHGKVQQGGDRRSKGHDALLIFAPGKELSAAVQERLGFGPDKYKRAVRIGRYLHPELRNALRGTGAEVDQSRLLKLFKLPADDQIRIAAALKEHPDLDLALSFLKPPKPALDPEAQLLARLCDLWEKASEDTREQFLEAIGMSDRPDPLMKLIREATE